MRKPNEGDGSVSESRVSAAYLDKLIIIQIEGEGSIEQSTALRDFYRSSMEKGYHCFCVDLTNCPYMYSTFIGTLVRMGLDMQQRHGQKLTITGVSEKNLNLLDTLQLAQVFEIRKDPFNKVLQSCQDIPCLPCSELEKAEMILNAHNTLAEASDANRVRFEDVRTLLKKDVERLRQKKKQLTDEGPPSR